MPTVFMPLPEGIPPDAGSTRPHAVVADLAALHGPTTGVRSLPKRLFWWPGGTFDLGDDGQAETMYAAVISEAASDADLAEHLDRALLIRLWPALSIPAWLRCEWERRHPVLAPGT